MKIQLIYLENYDWLIKIFYHTTPEDADIILKELDEIDCEPEAFYKAADTLESGEINAGFTYTDENLTVSFIIINKTSSAKEFLNTMSHEITHVSQHIAQYRNIKPASEEVAYLVGDIAYEMYDVAKEFLCEHCRNINLYNFGKIKIKMKKES